MTRVRREVPGGPEPRLCFPDGLWYLLQGITSGPSDAGLGNLGRTPKVPSRIAGGRSYCPAISAMRGCGRGSDNQVSDSRRCPRTRSRDARGGTEAGFLFARAALLEYP